MMTWDNGDPQSEDKMLRQLTAAVCKCGRPARMTGMVSREPRCDEHGREELRQSMDRYIQKDGAA